MGKIILRTFISKNSHHDLLFQLNKSLDENQERITNAIVTELIDEKKELELTYLNYLNVLEDLNELIDQYKIKQNQLRKKMRVLQIKFNKIEKNKEKIVSNT